MSTPYTPYDQGFPLNIVDGSVVKLGERNYSWSLATLRWMPIGIDPFLAMLRSAVVLINHQTADVQNLAFK